MRAAKSLKKSLIAMKIDMIFAMKPVKPEIAGLEPAVAWLISECLVPFFVRGMR